MNFGVSEEEAKKRAREALIQVGLSEDVLERSPFDLIWWANATCCDCGCVSDETRCHCFR